MSVALLDVNVLFALAWPNHVHREAAEDWFGRNRPKGWATCPLTQLAFLRLSTQPAVVKSAITMRDAQAVLAANLGERDHEFWPMDYPVTEIFAEISGRMVGHRQVTDALLLGLAIRRRGKLATLDRRIEALPASNSTLRHSIEILPLP